MCVRVPNDHSVGGLLSTVFNLINYKTEDNHRTSAISTGAVFQRTSALSCVVSEHRHFVVPSLRTTVAIVLQSTNNRRNSAPVYKQLLQLCSGLQKTVAIVLQSTNNRCSGAPVYKQPSKWCSSSRITDAVVLRSRTNGAVMHR